MGSQCSHLYDQLTHDINPRDKILELIQKNTITAKKSQKSSNFTLNFDMNLQHISDIQKQTIKQGSNDILSFEKITDSRYAVKFIDGSQYKGFIDERGKRDKEGQQTWSDGTKLIGLWKANLPHGCGIIISPSGFTFEGFWNLGMAQGFGKYYGKQGSYEGDWKNNKPHGFGVQTWQDGSKYEGNFQNGRKHGKGNYVWPDKSSFNGDWWNGQINGEGIYRYVDGRMYQGSFKENKMDGKVNTYGLTEENTLESTSRIKSKDSVNIIGPMEVILKDNGEKEKETETERSYSKMDSSNMGFGQMTRRLTKISQTKILKAIYSPSQ